MSIGFLYTSHYNYPGGVAFDRLHQLAADQKGLSLVLKHVFI
jgi:hypothetical protein